MKKVFFYALMMAFGLSFGLTSCSSDDNDEVDAVDLDYTSENASAWGNYMKNVAALLNEDSQKLYSAWNGTYENTGKSFATLFKTQDAASGYTSLNACIQEMIEKMGEIANEVGSSKIGDPYQKWVAGNHNEALLAVESWYSWHSRDDYTNNIMSIKNAYYGVTGCTYNTDPTPATKSLANYLKGTDIDTKVRAAIDAAAKAIQAIPQPFRSNIASTQTVAAMDACETLQRLLGEIETDDGTVEGEATNLKDYAIANLTDEQKQNVIDQFVDVVVVPTYQDLAQKNASLLAKVNTFVANPTNANMEAVAEAWLVSRKPWETSEAFLFGPVDTYGLDPNMDSWPLDAEAIYNILKSQTWSELEWADGDDESKVESAQNVRGFHTLEYLVFKDGNARTVK